MWQIKSITDKKYSCEQALLISYAKHLNREYQMLLSDSWGFNYYAKGSIGEKISPGYRKSRYDNYERFHGIKVNNKKIFSKEELIYFINENIQLSPLMIDFDTYYCPWNKLYQKKSIYHRVLIIDIIDEMHYKCIDHYNEHSNIIDISALSSWEGIISTFVVNEIGNIPEISFMDDISKHSEYLKKSNMLVKLKNFFGDLESNSLVNYGETYAGVPGETLILINLNRIMNQRLCFKEYLEYINGKCSIQNLKNLHLINLFDEMASKYSMLKMLIAKELVQGRLRNKTKLIEDIFQLELEAFNEFTLLA